MQESAAKFLDAGDAESALEILLVLLEESSRGIEYIDYSDGELGGFVGDLGTSLAEAILSMELSQVERDRLVRRLEKLIDYAGDYGMEGNLDIAVQAAKYGWDDIPEKMMPLQRTAHQVDEDDELDGWDEEDEFELREWGCALTHGFDLRANAGEESVSILPLLRGGDQPVHELIVNQSSVGLPAIRKGSWKLFFGPGSGGSPPGAARAASRTRTSSAATSSRS